MPERESHQLIKIPVKIPKSSLTQSLGTKTMLKQPKDDAEDILYLHLQVVFSNTVFSLCLDMQNSRGLNHHPKIGLKDSRFTQEDRRLAEDFMPSII